MARPRTYDQATRDNMAAAYKAGASMRDIAEHYGLSTAGVFKILKEYGLAGKSPKKEKFDFNSLQK